MVWHGVRAQWSRQLIAQVAASFVFRFACYLAMALVLLWNEGRPAPHLPDLVIDHLPYVEVIDRYNYILWLVAYVPVALGLLALHPRRFVRYMVSAGVLALLRALCIAVTGLGPVRGPDLHAGLNLATWTHLLNLLMPASFFSVDGGARVSLTKDLFFSGHTATTFLLLLYVWPIRKLRWPMLFAHVAVVVSVFLSHLHYTIDVFGAYFATVTVYAWREQGLSSTEVKEG